MSLHPHLHFPIPEETRRIAQAAFPKGTLCLQMGDHLGTLYQDQQFASLFPTRGQPAEAPARLALITVLQFVEGLSDRQAADAVRGRIDWKYVLALDLTDPGFDFSVLCEFRARLLAGEAEMLLLDTLLMRLQELGLLKTRGRQRTDSTQVLAAVRVLNRLERVGETLRATLNSLAVVAPEWIQSVIPAIWYERYGRRVENYHLPKAEAARQERAAIIGADGQHLLDAIDAATDQPWLVAVPAAQRLRQVWAEQYIKDGAQLRWRTAEEMPAPATLIASPYDPEARYSSKRSVEWVGYKVHFTETCDPERPHLIVNVETTPATTPDDHMIAIVHTALAQQGRLPAKHLVDKGYTDARVLLESQKDYQVTIIGPMADDPSWQARTGTGFDKARFHVDWERQVVTCPAGKHSISWLPNTYPKNGMVWEARFSRQDCTPCPFRSQCTRAKVEPRIIGLQEQEQYEVLQAACQQQTPEHFREQYAARAGIEATHAQAIRRCGLRRSRYIGLSKTHLQHVITAVALNLLRLGDGWNEIPLAPTRCSRFAALKPSALAA
ncbi:MAG TPA: IS1182 family transposase [Candidatus Competibacter sp.]|nr:IS1182 family transposase [Candidatus Competibacteraceae bacterium]MCP5135045.1 IS1182 family transposase [Gammaproteobacteria bacterium]HRW67824.1 IS1182 family transposase [Candidatus Competibacter sp.]